MDWRYWITYTGKITTPTDDEDVAMYAANDAHTARLNDAATTAYWPVIEVEPVEGREGE